MGLLDFVKSEEKRASSPEDNVVHGVPSGSDEVEDVGDELHRGMKPRQLSEYNAGSKTDGKAILLTCSLQTWQVYSALGRAPSRSLTGQD